MKTTKKPQIGMDWQHARLRLASASPRRLELLRQVGLEPEVVVAQVDETPYRHEKPADYVLRMALTKAKAGHAGQGLTLGADTAVVVKKRILGKPRSDQEALEILTLLSGRCHRVLTAVALCAGRHPPHACLVSTKVWFKPITPQERAAYIASREPQDKAGAYAIQGLGSFMVSRIKGSYSGVVGLPLFETLRLIRAALQKGVE